MNPVVDDVGELTTEWLTAALATSGVDAAVTAVTAERIGTGQIGVCYRLSLTYGAGDGDAGREPGRATLVAKLAAGDAAARERVKDGFAKEVGFYTRLADTVDVPIPHCWYGAISGDKKSFVLLLDDLAPARAGVQADGCTPAQAAACVLSLAGLHAPRWNDEALLAVDFLTPMDAGTATFLGEVFAAATDEFVARYDAELTAADASTLCDVAAAITPWFLARPTPFAVVHGDYRPDNLMFEPTGDGPGDGAVVLDWQTVSVGPPLRDLAYFLGTSLAPGDRRAHEHDLVRTYHEALAARGVSGYDLEACFEDYRLGQLHGPFITVLGCLYATAERSERSDGMFLAMATRSCAAIRDLRSLELL